MKRKKILVISYGGTIVMVVDAENKSVKPADDISEVLNLLPNLNSLADIDMHVLANKDSTNVTPDDWSKLAMFIFNKHDEYDGFIVTHGTNTMAYTASALALALGKGLKKPVVLTGAQLPLTVFGNDARFNFENSVKVCLAASEKNIAEVMIVFNDLVLRGDRTVKVSESSFRAFQSPAFHPLGTITSTGIIFESDARQINADIALEIQPHFSANIVSIDLTPGQRPSLMEDIVQSGKCKGVILKSHGAGSVPTEGEYSFLPFIQKTVNTYKIPVVVSTKFLGGNSYKEVNDECAILALENGAIPGGDMTDVMTEVKLMWLLAQGVMSNQDIGKALLTDYIGEVTPTSYTQK